MILLTCKLEQWRQRMFILALLVSALQGCQSRPPETNEPDQCPDTLKPEGINPYKMRGVLTPDGVEIMCCGLNPGFYYTGPCNPDFPSTTQYLPCPTGTFMDEKVHIEPRCKPHSNCPIHYGVKGPGNSTDDTECEKCQPGFDSLTNSRTESCTEIVQPRQDNHSIEENTDNEDNEHLTPKVSYSTKPDQSGTSLPSWVFWLLIGGLTVFIVIVIFGAVFGIFYYKKYKERGRAIERLTAPQASPRASFRDETVTLLPNLDLEPDLICSTLRRSSVDLAQNLSHQLPELVTETNKRGPIRIVECRGQTDVVPVQSGIQQSSSLPPPEIETRADDISNCTEREKEMYAFGYKWAKKVDKDDVNWIFRKLTVLSNPETEINNVNKPETPRERFIRLFQVLVKHGVEHFYPQRIFDVCIAEGWITYADLVRDHFPGEVHSEDSDSSDGG
ncbi:uncharacterized protein LOC143463128 [Clavelina lepadiformis]|uniref:TNFR-Cys domain-containing protein n=1 Tax=Clavelina lepadiformis TaxID=159417 RepID=A0ABP0FP41_CLALP